MGLFSSKEKNKPRAVAFVDYEYWYISMDKIHHARPDIGQWVAHMTEKYEVREIYFFADFSNESLSREIPKIRSYTNRIIETTNANSRVSKDFTDFIMLDHIYQRAMEKDDVSAFIIFTGDAHFNSVTAFLKNMCRKDVGIYGITGSLSSQLKTTASWYYEFPDEKKVESLYYSMIFTCISSLQKKDPLAKLSFMNTVNSVATAYNADDDVIQKYLQQLIDKGYITIKEEFVYNKFLRVMDVDWNRVSKDGLWTDGAPAPAVRQETRETRQEKQRNQGNGETRKPKNGTDVKKSDTSENKTAPVEKKNAPAQKQNASPVKQNVPSQKQSVTSEKQNASSDNRKNGVQSQKQTKPEADVKAEKNAKSDIGEEVRNGNAEKKKSGNRSSRRRRSSAKNNGEAASVKSDKSEKPDIPVTEKITGESPKKQNPEEKNGQTEQKQEQPRERKPNSFNVKKKTKTETVTEGEKNKDQQ